MEANEPGCIQFINSYHPGDTTSAKVQQRIHSHAARTTHARVRRLRMIDYQASKIIPEDSQEVKGQGTTAMSSVLSASNTVEAERLVLPSPVSLLASDRRDPFQSFAKPFERIEHFLLDHYVRAVLPYMNINCNKLRDPSLYIDLMTREWVRLTLTNFGSLNGVFLAACRHLLQTQPQYRQQYYIQLAIQYKLSSVRALREAILFETSSLISDSTVAIGILLAYDEVLLGDFSTLKCHLRGLIEMVEHNGGPQTMGSNGFLERLVSKFIGSVGRVEPSCKFSLKPW